MDFADDGTRVLQREIDIADGSSGPGEARDPSVPLEIFYELERTAAFVREGGFLRVALQFPDSLLHESAEPLLFVSGDTSYGACCVDEISAQHLGADAIVHYGRACLTPTAARIPVLFVFGAQPIDVADAAAAIGGAAARSPLAAGHAGNDVVIVGLTVQGITEAMLQQCSVLYIGGEGRRLSNVLMRCAGYIGRWSYDPRQPGGSLDGKQRTGRLREEVAGANRDLMRRYHQIQRAKEASVIGIVGAGMGVAGSSDIMCSLRAAVEDAGRKAYAFAVGRVNAAKLGNFAGVEAFCLVACAESSLLDTHEFPVPIVTPLELQIALGLREWDGFYSTDISDLARNPLTPRLSASSDGDPDAPFFSLVSGGYRGVVGDREMNNSGQQDAQGVLSKFVSPAAEFLMSREYRGLERKAGESKVHAAVDGAVGIASDYGGV
ncbi:putative diphthamide biosynthesis protein [Tribonema minus]|uniref:Putative diphthamide biosynthesis protein n=1 Tax=Tribonema minus TaxID=303371 RepID=A0A836CDL8_9STRA|nr:putative diphthamide biosynthesis protein [Tribonema minus]